MDRAGEETTGVERDAPLPEPFAGEGVPGWSAQKRSVGIPSQSKDHRHGGKGECTHLNPTTPLKLAGLTTLPPVCVPNATGTCQSPTAAPLPLLLPPGVRPSSCAFLARFCHQPPLFEHANSVVAVFPKINAPMALKLMTTLASTPLASSVSKSGLLYCVGMSLVSMTSLTAIGKPCRGPKRVDEGSAVSQPRSTGSKASPQCISNAGGSRDHWTPSH